ncbi:hypothetical protein QYF61_013448, partial [Mycteria americana]
MQYCSPRYGWLSGLQAHTASSCPVFHPPGPPSPSPWGCSQSFHLPACTDTRGCLTQVQYLALGLVEPHEVYMGPLLELVQVPLDGIPLLRCVNLTTQLGVICKLADSALDPTVYVIDEDTKQSWSQYGPLRDTSVDHYSLDVTIQPIPYPLNSPPIKSISLQFGEKDVVGDHDTCPCFHCLCISFLPFSLTSRSRLIHASLLPSFPDFLHMGIESCCTLWKVSLKICQLCSAPLSLRAVSQGVLLTNSLKSWIFAFPELRLLTHIPQDCKLHQCMITAAQAASNLDKGCALESKDYQSMGYLNQPKTTIKIAQMADLSSHPDSQNTARCKRRRQSSIKSELKWE